MRHIGFLVVCSKLALDGEEKDFKIPFLLKPARKTDLSQSCCATMLPLHSQQSIPMQNTLKVLQTLLKEKLQTYLTEGHSRIKCLLTGGLRIPVEQRFVCPILSSVMASSIWESLNTWVFITALNKFVDIF